MSLKNAANADAQVTGLVVLVVLVRHVAIRHIAK